MSDKELAKRAVASPHWRWMPGMMAIVVTETRSAPRYRIRDGEDRPPQHPDVTWRPDLDDPATVGCLLALVREAWSDPGISCVTASYSDGVYLRRVVGGHHHGSAFQAMSERKYSTEAEALLAALGAAPFEALRGDGSREVEK